RAARDPNAAVRQSVLHTLQAQPIFPQAAGEQLTLSLLAKLAWAEPTQQRNFQKSLATLLKPKMEQDTVWVKHLINAALGELQSDTPAEVIAQLLGERVQLPTSILPDCVKLLSHPVYGGPAANMLLGAPRAAFEPVCEGLRARKPSDRAAAAQLLGKLAKVGQADGVTNEQYRQAMDELSAMVNNESNPEARAAARIALNNLTANGR
ncbi:MAG: hypothetical protein SNJ82_14940, partial [Gemmataceae bacterium]